METTVKSGDKGEIMAIKHLQGLGYKIISTNYKVQGGEIDIISENNGNIIFVEVKYRKSLSHGSPEEALTITKRKNILRAIKYYAFKNRINEENLRFEFIGITEINGKFNLNHIKDVEL